MPEFSYRARDKDGGTVEGSIEAPDSRAAAARVRDMGCWPLSIVEAEETSIPASRRRWGIPFGPSLRSQAVFFRQLAAMLKAGMPVGGALDSLSRQRGIGGLSSAARSAAEHVRAGGMLSEAFARYPRLFSRLQLGLIRAGESGGMLDAMVDRVAAYLERELKLRQRFSRVTFYPKMLLVFILATVIFLPQIGGLVQGSTSVFQILRSSVLPFIPWLAAAYIGGRYLLLVPQVRFFWDGIKLYTPILGSVTRKLAMSRFGAALSVLYSAGLPLTQAVEISSEAMGNEILRRAALSCVPHIRSGKPLSEALRQTGETTELVQSMISTGEQTGNLSQVLDKVSEYYDSEAEGTIEKMGYGLFALLILAGGLAVAIIVIRFYAGYASGLVP